MDLRARITDTVFFDADSGMGGRYMDARYRSTKAKYWRIDDADVVTVGPWRVKERTLGSDLRW